MIINGLNFRLTCEVAPEQYDVYKDGEQVGYVRLRWGCLTCYVPDYGDKIVYEAEFDDGFLGCFEDEEQRIEHLEMCAKAILEEINEI